MKFLFLIVALSVFVGANALTGCAVETGANMDLVTRAKAGDFDFEDATMKKFFFCMFKKMGFINDKGEIFTEAAMATTTDDNRDQVKKALDNCKNTTGANNEELSWNYAKCYSKEFPEDIFIDE